MKFLKLAIMGIAIMGSASAKLPLFDLMRQKLGTDDQAFTAGLNEAEVYVEAILENPDRNTPHPLLNDVYTRVISAVQERLGPLSQEALIDNIRRRQERIEMEPSAYLYMDISPKGLTQSDEAHPFLKNLSGDFAQFMAIKMGQAITDRPVTLTWNTIIPELIHPLKFLPTSVKDMQEVMKFSKKPSAQAKGISKDFLTSLEPFYQCPLFSENLKDGLLGYATMNLATAYKAWLSVVTLQDYNTPSEWRGIPGFLMHDAVFHLRTIRDYPKMFTLIQKGEFLKLIQRVLQEENDPETLKAYMYILFQISHEKNIELDTVFDIPADLQYYNQSDQSSWMEPAFFQNAFVNFCVKYGKIVLSENADDTAFYIDRNAFALWLRNQDPKQKDMTKTLATLEKDFPAVCAS